MSSASRIALLRQQRRQAGLKETTIWMTPEMDRLLNDLATAKGLRNRSEAIEYALRQFRMNEETQMSN